MESVGVIAGSGIYPEIFIQAAKKAGVKKVVACAFHNETKPDIERSVEETEWVRVGQLSKMIQFFVKQGIKQCVMVGQIAPKNLFDLRPDLRTLFMMAKLKKRNAETLFGAIAAELEKDGIELLPATTFLEDDMPTPGMVIGPKLKSRRWEDAAFGFEIAKASSNLDIGQTVIVKNGTVLAVEAFEGTNDAIKRGGALGKGNSTMVKVSKLNQDMRFDVPVIGPDTIKNAAAAGVDVIAVEAGMTLILGRDVVYNLCHDLKVTLVGIDEEIQKQFE